MFGWFEKQRKVKTALLRQFIKEKKRRLFILDGITPKYKIDITKYPPEKWKRAKPGPKI
jgi:hypothetical protein